ncbi:MAG: hypothetical protein MR698_03370 [Selenomonas sp.]|nr:hypothetical protein [Selenomonas sp.]
MNQQDMAKGTYWNYRPHAKMKKQEALPIMEQVACMVVADIKRRRKIPAVRRHYLALQEDGMSEADAAATVAASLRQAYTNKRFQTNKRSFAVYPNILQAVMEAIDFAAVAAAVLAESKGTGKEG